MNSRPFRVLFLVPLLTSCAGLASVSGKLVPRGAADPSLSQAVVYVLPQDPGLGERLPDWSDRASLTFTRGSLKPAVSVATVGSWLEIWNADTVFHQPFSRSPAARFNGISVRPRTGTAIRLAEKGMVRIFCQLHGGESAELLVLENGAWTRPDTTGAFRLPPLPRGKYVIHAWHPRLGEQTVPIDIEHTGPLSVELHY
ncbi:MAG: hypothetical protein E6K72_00665 [Candidatus Eisenbacteria bacterium]|uniref:Rhamnogalacturonan lyase domain-containing protein n=1 Tax=Eiseniibacteriota bacterium TaxID=2212470 RepID=A0A538T9L7_UNCEI|nr:MAG: hypothetical protein E6K72_00665 [Candidatus Eisenbacteria bacterium]